jgi:hypothetical protein
MNKSALLILLVAGAAWAQTPKPTEEKPASPPPKRPLNLKLEDAARYTREEPNAKSSQDNLPALGGGSTSFDRAPETTRAERPTVYPKDWETGR